MKYFIYTFIGAVFGATLVKSQVVSWYRIQEMFLFDNFHMYGVIGTAVVSAAIFLFVLKKYYPRTIDNQPLRINTRDLNNGTIYGGILFGLGWSITGACPGPLYSLVGNGYWIYLIVILSALVGVFFYGRIIAK